MIILTHAENYIINMGIKQNIKLWENYVTYLDENGNTKTKRLPRSMPQNPYKVARLLSARSWLFFFVGL
jgi:SHS family lactate transporter-like MFS transporter